MHLKFDKIDEEEEEEEEEGGGGYLPWHDTCRIVCLLHLFEKKNPVG